jgi:hypothetical protein
MESQAIKECATFKVGNVMNLAGIILFLVWMSLCVVVIGGWAFKTLDDDSVIIKWDDDKGRWVDINNPIVKDDDNESGNLLG